MDIWFSFTAWHPLYCGFPLPSNSQQRKTSMWKYRQRGIQHRHGARGHSVCVYVNGNAVCGSGEGISRCGRWGCGCECRAVGWELDLLWCGERKRREGKRGGVDLGEDGRLGGHHDKRKHSVKSEVIQQKYFLPPCPLLYKRREEGRKRRREWREREREWEKEKRGRRGWGGHDLTEWDGESSQPTLGLRMCEMFTLCLSIGKWGLYMCVIKERTGHSLKYLKRWRWEEGREGEREGEREGRETKKRKM